jgi:hypothetical protein
MPKVGGPAANGVPVARPQGGIAEVGHGSQAMSRVLPLRPKQRLNPGSQVSRAQIKLERHHVPRGRLIPCRCVFGW